MCSRRRTDPRVVWIAGHEVGRRMHEPVWRDVGGTKVQAIRIPVLERADAASTRADASPWLVIIATPTQHHVEHLSWILSAYPHACVLVEKPVGTDPDALQRLFVNQHRVLVNYQLRFAHLAKRLLCLARDRSDRPSAVVVRYVSGAFSRRNVSVNPHARHEYIEAVLYAIGSHLFDLLHYCGLGISNEKTEFPLATICSEHRRLRLQYVAASGPRVVIEIDPTQDFATLEVELRQSSGRRSRFDALSDIVLHEGQPASKHAACMLRTACGSGLWYSAYAAFVRECSKHPRLVPSAIANAARLPDALYVLQFIKAIRGA